MVANDPQPPFRGIDWDDSLEQPPRAVEALARGQLRVERWLAHHARTKILALRIIEGFHRQLFLEVFPDFAGRLRGPSPRYIPRNCTFGVFRGASYECVPDKCVQLCDTVVELISQLDQLRITLDEKSFDEEVLKVASYTHCSLIEIHPFVNGNGRTARTSINYFAWRYGMLPVPFERQPDGYLAANRTWLQQQAIDHFMNFLRPNWQRRRA